MRTDDDDLADVDDIDDTYCTRQRPKRRCCLVWHQVGAYTVIACTHCPRVKRSYESDPGDAERVAESRASHELRCERQFWTIPAQRTQYRRRETATSAVQLSSKAGT